MNWELVDADRAWLLAGPLPVSALCDMVGHYLMTPLPVVASCRIEVWRKQRLVAKLVHRLGAEHEVVQTKDREPVRG